MTVSLAILQSNYIPWKGYFDLIASVDKFIVYDEVQYTKQDWRNRNRIKTPRGVEWLSVPVTVNNLYNQKIFETNLAKKKWGQSHWSKLQASYSISPFFEEISDWLKPLFLDQEYRTISELNITLIKAIARYLLINTEIIDSRVISGGHGKNERLVEMCKAVSATEYVSGPAAQSYLDVGMFNENGISVKWFDYSNYKEYTQHHGEFRHDVTILDLLFELGKEAPKYMKLSI